MATATKSIRTRLKPYRFGIHQYLAMIGMGILPDGAHVELLDGRLVVQMTKYAPHNFTSRQLGIALKEILGAGWIISEEKSLVLGRRWRPEPGLAVIQAPNSRYRKNDPNAADVGLLIEVAESSYAIDRGEKWRAYAAARIPAYWIVNLNRSQVEVYGGPTGRGKKASYRETAVFDAEAEISVVIGGQEFGRIVVKDLLP